MSARLPRWFAVSVTVLAATAAPGADPLPEGAVARIGVPEVHHGNPHALVAVSADGTLTPVREGHVTARAPAGGRLATGSDKGDIILSAGDPIAAVGRLTGHTAYVAALAFSPDGKTLASGSNDRTLRLWDAKSGKELHVCAGHGDQVSAVAFAPDGKTVASASLDGGLRLWDVATGKELRRCEGHRYGARAVAFTADGKTLASGGADGTVRLWDAATAKEVRRWTVHASGVLAVAFTRDGKGVVTADGQHDVRYWDMATGKARKPESAEPFATPAVVISHTIECGALSPDGKTAALARADGTVRLHDTATGKELRVVGRHPGTVWGVAFSPDGKTLASCARRHGVVRLWDVATGDMVRSYPGHAGGVSRVLFTRDGKQLIAGGGSFDPSIIAYDTATAKEVRRFEGHAALVDGLALSPDGTALASADSDGAVRLWDFATGKGRRSWTGPDSTRAPVAFSSDGTRLLATDPTGRLCFYDVANGKARGDVDGVGRWFGTSADGRTLAVETADGRLALVEAATGRERRRWDDEGQTLSALAFSADGRRLLTDADNGIAIVWDLTGGAREGMTARERDDCWRDLAADGKTSSAALWRLILSPKQGVPLLREKVKPAKRGDATNVPRWVAELDDDSFDVREKATKNLQGAGEAARAALEKAAAASPSAEVKRRAESLLARLDGGEPGGEELRELRALEALEMIGTAEARAVIEGLAKGDAAARLTREAKAALLRIGGER